MNNSSEMMMRHNMMNTPVEMMMKNWRHSLPVEIRDVAFRPMSMVEYNSFSCPITYHADGSRMLNLCFDVKGFKPEEIKVEILNKERTIVVEAKHEVKEKEHHVTRHFTRRFVLPEELHIDLSKIELKSCLTPEGLLVIESVLPRLSVEELKTIREKPSTKHMMHNMPSHSMHPMHFNPTVAIPIKMN
jgi:HSP20 family molecular chaperone IbpA